MIISPFGLIIIISFFYFLKAIKRELLDLYIVTAAIISGLFLDVGYIFNFGGFQIDYYEFFLILGIFFIKGKITINQPKNHEILIEIILLIVIFFLIIISFLLVDYGIYSNLSIKPVDSGFDAIFNHEEFLQSPAITLSNFKSMIGFILFIIFVFKSRSIITLPYNLDFLKQKIVICLKIIIVIFFLELIINLIFGKPYIRYIINFIFGERDSQVTRLIERVLVTAYSLFSEPSHYAFSLFIIMLFLFDYLYNNHPKLLIISIITFVLCGSLTGFVLVLYPILLYLKKFLKIQTYNQFLLKYVIGLNFIIGIVLYIVITSELIQYILFNFDRLSGLFGLALSVGSEGSRIFHILNIIPIIKQSPIWGLSLGTTNAPGFMPTILSNFGILGTFIYFLFFIKIFKGNNTRIIFSKILIVLGAFIFMGQLNTIYSPIIILVFLSFIKFQKEAI